MYSIRLQWATTTPKRVVGGEGMDHGILLLTEAAEYVFRDFLHEPTRRPRANGACRCPRVS